MNDIIGKLKRGVRKPPRVILERILSVCYSQLERVRLPLRNNLSENGLLKELRCNSIDELWARLANRECPYWLGPCHEKEIQELCGSNEISILSQRTNNALLHRVDLLGSGLTQLGVQIDWLTDFKTGFTWKPSYFTDIDYTNLDRPSDVKTVWELSRLQWLIPVGQSYLISYDEIYALAVRDVLSQWIDANPVGFTVNWSCTMEAAFRIFTWSWFFHVFKNSQSWMDKGFRFRFLRMLYLHVEFANNHIERSDINGNHFTADASSLVVGGLFFGIGQAPEYWQAEGWRLLCEEFPRQVFDDGVDFEASVPYHRLVTELFLLPAMYRTSLSLTVDSTYLHRLSAMAAFSRAYSTSLGTVPLWGDADDARVLPFGTQSLNDHRYLHSLIAFYLGDLSLLDTNLSGLGELLWNFGPCAVRCALDADPLPPLSKSFPDGGFYVMRKADDHIFIDCGPLGLSGRGGHGHNDCLSFEAVLSGKHLISDCGAYLYTANSSERNNFRSTAYHNTPQVDNEEMNRFIRPDYLWNLHYDAIPNLLNWTVQHDFATFVGEHNGFLKLKSPVIPRRTIIIDFNLHGLCICDQFFGEGVHNVFIPLHLASNVCIRSVDDCQVALTVGNASFKLWWNSKDYIFSVEDARISPSYGVIEISKKILWSRYSESLTPFCFFIAPSDSPPDIESRLAAHLV